MNVRSLVSITDMVNIWTHSTDADVTVVSEMIREYNVSRTDLPKRGGVAIYIKNKFQVNVLLSKSVVKT